MKAFSLISFLLAWCLACSAQPGTRNAVLPAGNGQAATPGAAGAGYLYSSVSFYVVAHEDDWQLFMGDQAWRDIQSHNDSAAMPNGAKTVFIYVTDGAFCKDDSAYNNSDPMFIDPCTYKQDVPYSTLREGAAMNSIFAVFAAAGPHPQSPYALYEAVPLNGHRLTAVRYKSTVSYFLRIHTYCVDQWCGLYAPAVPQNLSAPGYTTDGNVYAGNADLVNTIAAIYNYECAAAGDAAPGGAVSVNIQDPNTGVYNICDHNEHTWTGTAAFQAEAAYASALPGTPVLPVTLWEDYVIAGGCQPPMPINLGAAGINNKTALITAYELTLLQDKSFIEWDEWMQFLNRSYNRASDTKRGW